jgi:hypothetical protein
MVYGWGLQVKSWGWLFLGYFLANNSFLFVLIAREEILKALGLIKDDPVMEEEERLANEQASDRMQRAPELDFLNGVHHPGENVTVRRGYKWANRKIGELVRLTTEGKDTGMFAFIRKIIIKPFWMIEDSEIQKEHDSECRTKEGLLAAMKKAYGDFRQTEPCVLLTYEPVEMGD